MKNLLPIRQGDVLLVPVSKLPEGCTEIPPENGRIVLMHGEVTGHAHAIADWDIPADTSVADQIIKGALNLSGRRARLMLAPNGNRFLEVCAPVNLTHEEHTAHQIPPGIYELPEQMEHSAERMRRVQD